MGLCMSRPLKTKNRYGALNERMLSGEESFIYDDVANGHQQTITQIVVRQNVTDTDVAKLKTVCGTLQDHINIIKDDLEILLENDRTLMEKIVEKNKAH